MGFIDDLKKGLPGVRFALPGSIQVHEEQDRRAVFVDNDRKVGWHVLHAPWRLDLRGEHHDVLRRDIERQSRFTFEEQYQQLAALIAQNEEALKQRLPVRTLDPKWTPVVSVDHFMIGDAPAVQIIRRVAYEPMIEVVVGSLLIPLATGMVEITTFHRTQETGRRESMLLQLAMQRYPGEDLPALAARLGQTFFDDPSHDRDFATHPLSLVRSALRWLREAGPEVLAVTAPMAAISDAPVEMPAAGCSVLAPPRYLPLPRGTVPVPRTMSVMTRVMLEASESPRMLDVFRLTDVEIPGSASNDERQQLLQELARRNGDEWSKQGATDIELTVAARPPQGDRVEAGTVIRMKINGLPTLAVSRWLAEKDGHVFRLAVGSPTYVSVDELEKELDFVAASFKRIEMPTNVPWLTSDLSLKPKKVISASAS